MDVCICRCVYVLVCGIRYILMFEIIHANTSLFSNTRFFFSIKRESKWMGVGEVVGDGDKWQIGRNCVDLYIKLLGKYPHFSPPTFSLSSTFFPNSAEPKGFSKNISFEIP